MFNQMFVVTLCNKNPRPLAVRRIQNQKNQNKITKKKKKKKIHSSCERKRKIGEGKNSLKS